MLTFVNMNKELKDANQKKVWTNVTLRLDQKMKLKILERANNEGLNTNQFLAKIVNHYLEDSTPIDNAEMYSALLDLVGKCQDRIGRLSFLNADLTNKLHAVQIADDKYTFLPPDLAEKRAENEVIKGMIEIDKKFKPGFKEDPSMLHDLDGKE